MKVLYKDNLSLISKRTVTGKIGVKEAVSPKKMLIITSIFQERIDALPNVDSFAKILRKENMRCRLAKIISHMSAADSQSTPEKKGAK